MEKEFYHSKFLVGLRCIYLALLAILCFCFVALWMSAFASGAIFYCIFGEVIGGSKFVWFIFNTCLTCVVPIMGFTALTLVSGLISWCYRKIRKLAPDYSNLRGGSRQNKSSVAYIVAISYVIAFIASTLIQALYISKDVIGEFMQTTEKYGLSFIIILGPLFLLALVAIVVGVVWFCAALLPTTALLKRVVRYIFAQSVWVGSEES